MKIKNHLKTNSFRTIKKSFPRFISLMIMSLLGVLVYVGLASTSPDMINTIDKYFDDYNTYDIKIISSMGLTDEDIAALKNIESINEVEGIYSKEVLIENDETEIILTISSLPSNINQIELISGRLPINDTEIVVEENFLTKLGYELNDTITLEDDTFKNKEVTIVGTVNSTLYFNNTRINQDRGSTTIGTGTINYYSYTLSSNFDIDYYTTIYITVDNALQETTSKSKYLELISSCISNIEEIKEIQEDNRYNNIYDEAYEEIIANEVEADAKLAESKQDLDEANQALKTAKNELTNSKKQLTNAKKQLDNAKKQIDEGQEELSLALQQYGITDIEYSLKEVNKQIIDIQNILSTIDEETIEYTTYQENLTNLLENKTILITLQETEQNLIDAQNEYTTNYNSYQANYKKYQQAIKEYNKGLKEYNEGLEEYENAKQEVEEEIASAKEELDTIEHPVWYIYDRGDDQTYSSYIKQTKSMKSLSGLFPFVFYAVAILVSLISMNRMVEDDRGEIGTLKSLGFTNVQIVNKYFIFSLIATLIGGLIGSIIGLLIIPYLIFTIYCLLFDIPIFQFGLNLPHIILGVGTAIICICGSAIITAHTILKDKPATLMRPKAPKSGKKVFLENFKLLWHKLKFSNKITIRNLLRYKKRVLVTIFGISGCTALMLCGFGIKDSIIDITNMQYVDTFLYDVAIYTNNLDPSKIDSIKENEKITSYTLSETLTGTIEDSSVSMIITEDNESLKNIANLVNTDTNKEATLEEGSVLITNKLAETYNIEINDTITILDSDKKTYTFKVSGIVNNYLGHYVYLSKTTLESNNIEYNPNVIYINTIELNDKEKDELSNELLEEDYIINVIHMSTLVNSAQDMLDSLNKVIIILVVLSASLSFVVLYNLSNINISERTREIATLKVLGFYNKEVDNYITKETIILTIIGIIFGLAFGYLLTNMVISTVEMEDAHFIRQISINSYIYSSLISALFTIIVNYVTHFTLKKINMIESLKSVE